MKEYKYGICITTYNRPEYLERFFATLKNTEFLDNTIVRILDDCSDERSTKIIEEFMIDSDKVKLFKETNIYNLGPGYNYTKNILNFKEDDVDYIINLDSDSVHNPKWLKKINLINNLFGPKVLSSVFWCDHGYPYEKIELEETFLKTRSLNGLCLCFPKFFMQDFIDKKGSRSFDGFTSYDLKKKYDLETVVTELSYVEHIGLHGVNYPPDIAKKFVGI